MKLVWQLQAEWPLLFRHSELGPHGDGWQGLISSTGSAASYVYIKSMEFLYGYKKDKSYEERQAVENSTL